MKERPILFSTAMVQAILEGRKTKTRRTKSLEQFSENFTFKDRGDGEWSADQKGSIWSLPIRCPYGQPGDVLWVKEKHRVISWDFEDAEETEIQYADKASRKVCLFDDFGKNDDFLLKIMDKMHARCEPAVDEENEWISWTKEQVDEHMPWTPSIHMPKTAARIWLQVVSVKVERLQDITEQDAKLEGCKHAWDVKNEWDPVTQSAPPNFRRGFSLLWDEINGQDAWLKNPWVWVVEFKRINKLL